MNQQTTIHTFGWYAHYVTSGDTTPFGVNYHTHGLETKYNHPDIQICVPLPFELIHAIAWNAVRFIEQGNKFEVGKMYDCILEDYYVQFIVAQECKRMVLRMVLPDKNGRFDTEPYVRQFENILHIL